MKSLLTIVALLLQQAGGPSVFDQPIAAMRGEKAEGPLDRMSLNQMMRMSALPPARMREFQCAGIANWAGSRDWPVFALGDAERAAFVDRVAAAFALDLEMDKAIAMDLIAEYSREPPHRQAKGEGTTYRASMERDCGALIAAVRSGTYQLSPGAEPAVINTTLATCHARYLVAAEASRNEKEAASLRATAARAEAMALAGKEGEALVKARAALQRQVEAVRADSGSAGDEMMRLVVCLPAMDVAGKEQAR